MRKNKDRWYWCSRKEELRKWKKRGLSYREIGEMYGVCKTRAYYIFKMFERIEKFDRLRWHCVD